MLEINKLNMNKVFFWIDVYCLIGSLIIRVILFLKNGIDVIFGWFCAVLSTANVISMQLRNNKE